MGRTNSRDAQLAASWLDNLRTIERLSNRTVYDYSAVISAFLAFRGGAPAEQARLQDLRAFLQRPRQKTLDVTASTLSRESAALRSFYRFCVAEEAYGKDPSVLLPRQRRGKRLPRPVDDTTWLKLWSKDLSPTHRAFFGLAFFCGLRRAELARLETAKVNHQDLRVIRKGDSEDIVPISLMVELVEPLNLGGAAFVDALQAQGAARSNARTPLLFPFLEEVQDLRSKRPRAIHPLADNVLDPQIAQKRCATFLRDLAMPAAFTLHQLRHSCATNLVRSGVPIELVQRLLNHESITTTTQYTQVTNADVEAYAELRRRHPRQ